MSKGIMLETERNGRAPPVNLRLLGAAQELPRGGEVQEFAPKVLGP